MAYARRYGGGFVDLPVQTTAADSQFFNAVEDALLKLLTADGSVDGQVLQWINASSRFGPALLLNKNVDAAAAIAWSKLATTGAIRNVDVAGAAAIAKSKLDFGTGLVNADIAAAAAIAISKLAGYPTDAGMALLGDGSWGRTIYKPAPVTINNNTPTNLLSQAVAANTLGTKNKIRVVIEGTQKNTKGTSGTHRILISFGGTTLIDYTTGAIGSVASRGFFTISFDLYASVDNQHVAISNGLGSHQEGLALTTTGIGGGTDRGPGRFASNGSVAVDTSVSQTLVVQATLSATDASFDITAANITMEVVA